MDRPPDHHHPAKPKSSTLGIVGPWLQPYRTWIAASTAAVSCLVVGFPFDSVKTRMQTHPYKSMLDCAQKTYRSEGLAGFYRGILPPLFTVSFLKSISFTVYEATKYSMASAQVGTHSIPNGHPVPTSLIIPSFLGGAVSGAAVALASGPLELVKIQKQLERLRINNHSGAQTLGPDKGSWATARGIIRQHGPRGLFYGFPMHLTRDMIGTGTYFAGYEYVKTFLTHHAPASMQQGPLTFLLAGGFCGVLCWIVTFPLDLVKSVMQQAVSSPPALRQSVPEIVRSIWVAEGPRGFYRGVGVTLVRAFPIHALNFVAYEGVSGWIRKHGSPSFPVQ